MLPFLLTSNESILEMLWNWNPESLRHHERELISSLSREWRAFLKTTSPDLRYLGIGLYLNSNSIARVQTEESNSVANQFSPLSLQLTLDLAQDANIWLQIDIMSSGLFCMTTQLVKEVAIGPISPVGCWKRKSSRRHLCEFWWGEDLLNRMEFTDGDTDIGKR